MTIGVKLEQEPVPASKRYMISTRENSEYKWQNDAAILGALEVPSDPYFRLDGEYNSRPVSGKEEIFGQALEVWDRMNLREEFQRAAEAGPKATCCCGLIPDDDATIKNLIPALNMGWVKKVNKRLAEGEGRKFTIDVFLWQWNNVSGKSETNILLIRFFGVPSKR